LTEAVRKSHESAELATKADLQEYESVIRGDLEKLELGLRHEMGDLRHEIGDLRKDMDARFVGVHAELSSMKWVLGMVAAGMVALLVKSFF